MDAAVCMPWRETPDRAPAFNRATDFWTHHGFEVITSDSEPARPFSIAQARNRAVADATTDWVIIADADCIPDIASIHHGFTHDGMIWPTDDFRYISPDWAQRPDLMCAPVNARWRQATGGLMMCRRELFWNLGGYDEGFTGWGFEDAAIHAVAATLSQVHHLPGVLFSFDHGGARDQSAANPAHQHYQNYHRAIGDRAAMSRVIEHHRRVRAQ